MKFKHGNSTAAIAFGLLLGLIFGLALFLGLYFGLPPRTVVEECSIEPPEDQPLYGEYKSAAVSTDAGPCSVIGKNLLKRGGSVVDSAIGAMLCVGLLNSHSTGIGGGNFMNVYDAESGRAYFINAREVAPIDATENMYKGDSDLSRTGASAVAVPGEIAGYWYAHQRFGKLPWKDLFAPTIKLAAEGYTINSALASAIRGKSTLEIPLYNLEPIFVNPNGTRKVEGDTSTSPSLANTLRTIAEEGAIAFYNGSLTQRILDDLRDAPGENSRIKKEDLNNYSVDVKELINITIGDYMVLTPGAPSGGPVLLYILNILKGYEFEPNDVSDMDSKVLTYHRILEAFKFAYAKRTELGDDNFSENITKLIDQLTNDEFAEQTRLKIDDSSTQPTEFYEPSFLPPPSDDGTAHLSIVGPDGSAVAMTSTINGHFGSSVRGFRTGIIFNNEMDDFSSPNITNIFGVPPSPANLIQPGKRPLSSMSPTIVIDTTKTGKDAVRILSGASGGTKITTATAFTIMNMMWFGNRVDDAVEMKRFHHQLIPVEAQFEKGFDEGVINGLKSKNHLTSIFNPPGSVVQAIQAQSNGFIGAASDSRKSGYPSGY